MTAQRWATFDCYGTLVDWNTGIAAELERILGPSADDGRLRRYHEIEPRLQAEHPDWRYREIMGASLAELASESGAELRVEDRDALARSLSGWPVFPEVPGQLAEALRRGWALFVLSNSDRDLIEASMRAIGVPFEGAIVASEVGSYKPGHAHWREFYETTGADPSRHVHVAQSHFHDIMPAHELGIRTVWVNRLGERHDPPPARELPSLEGLPDVLDQLVS